MFSPTLSSLPPLTRMVAWAQTLLAPVLRPGDLAIDLTAGTGADTLFLARCVGPQGRVLAFDVQQQALQATATRLTEGGIEVHAWKAGPLTAGVHLVHDSHEHLALYLHGPARGVIANLGYLPGGDRQIVTNAGATSKALRCALERLVIGGRLAVVVYPGHPGGQEEAAMVQHIFAALPAHAWRVLAMQAANSPRAPHLLVAERRRTEPPAGF